VGSGGNIRRFHHSLPLCWLLLCLLRTCLLPLCLLRICLLPLSLLPLCLLRDRHAALCSCGAAGACSRGLHAIHAAA